MKRTKQALFHSIIALVLCFSMLIGTTFAWFTDSVTTGINNIVAGTLDVELEYLVDGNWETVTASTNVFEEDALWEPGHTEVVYLRISNVGDLALQYQLGVNVASENGSVNKAGKSFLLSDHIRFGTVDGVQTAYTSRTDAREAVTSSEVLSAGYTKQDAIEAGADPVYVALVVYMPEEVGNEANYLTGENPPEIKLGINLVATQYTSESDSFGSDYDVSVGYPKEDINFSVSQSVVSVIEDGVIMAEMTVGSTEGEIYATVPSGVTLAEGVDTLILTVNTLETSEADITLESGESKVALDVHMEGVAEGNTVPMLITLEGLLKKGLNTTSVAMYHVENGVTVAMTLVSDPVNHNEFSYDPATGDVVLCVASFSEYVAVTDNKNLWEGTAKTDWYNDTDTDFTLTTAEQLAGLGVLVDGGNTFEGKTVKLDADINLGGTISFNPIGCGYAYESYNSNSVLGRTFNGTFDGQGYTISGLYQNGWELGLSYCNLGGGLFASVCDATIKNLTISGAEITMECVEMGFVAGLAQGTCTFENINIYNSKIANYQRATGGIVGEVSPKYNADGSVDTNNSQTATFKNINMASSVTVGSLWGDFDCPVGGVIGARWDDNNVTKVVMDTVNVACTLDVYNDVTSTYQWYAYRRTGMLIGNTDEPAADGKNAKTAAASFLTCTNVKVYYGPWTDYHYCEFTNYNYSWPWVRVEAGENCEAYSNPRYGVPNDVEGNKVVDATHKHQDGDECNVEITFNQLYGGGQGVYGQTEHDGVEVIEIKYTITYVNNGEVLDVVFVVDNSTAKSTTNADAANKAIEWAESQGYTNVTVEGWMNAGSTLVPSVPANNTENIVLYPSFANIYSATFVDQQGNVLDWTTFTSSTIGKVTTMADQTTPPDVTDCEFDYWVILDDDGTTVKVTADTLSDVQSNITLYPIYTYNGAASMLPVDEDGDGDTDYYEVTGVDREKGTNVVIPNTVNGIPVTTISDNAFAGFDDLVAIRIPENVETLGSNALEDGPNQYITTSDRSTITIYYEGTPEQWRVNMDALYAVSEHYEEANGIVYENATTQFSSSWDDGLGDGSRVFFLNENGMVDNSCYWELWKKTSGILNLTVNYVWVFHDHQYTQGGDHTGCSKSVSGEQTNYLTGTVTVDGVTTNRPDTGYWTTE